MSVGVASGIYQHIKILPSILRTKSMICTQPILYAMRRYFNQNYNIQKQVKPLKAWSIRCVYISVLTQLYIT